MTTATGRFLLDTNIVILLFGNDKTIKNKLTEVNQVFLPTIVLGELYYGALKSHRVEQNVSRIRDLAESINALSCDTITAIHYGRIKNSLKLKGRPIPENDIWIAAIAKQHDLVPVSRDEHFSYLEDIKIDVW